VLFLVAFIIYAIIDRNRILKIFETIIGWMRDYPYLGPIIVIVAYIIATVLFLPGLVLTLGTGFAFTAAYRHVWSKSQSQLITNSIDSARIRVSLDWGRNWSYCGLFLR